MIAKDRLVELYDGRFYYGFKRTWKSGAKGIYFEGPDFLERLVALIPPPRKHQTRYHVVYAPNSRFQAVVKRMTAQSERALHTLARERRHTYWVLWAELLKRTFKAVVERCPVCLQQCSASRSSTRPRRSPPSTSTTSRSAGHPIERGCGADIVELS